MAHQIASRDALSENPPGRQSAFFEKHVLLGEVYFLQT